jgi:hypothetical protein
MSCTSLHEIIEEARGTNSANWDLCRFGNNDGSRGGALFGSSHHTTFKLCGNIKFATWQTAVAPVSLREKMKSPAIISAPRLLITGISLAEE